MPPAASMRRRIESVQGSAPNTPTRRGSSRMSTPISRGAVEQMQKVGGRAADGRHLEIFHHHDLPVGIAAGDGNHRRPQRLGAVMGPQSSREQAVAVSVLNNVAAAQAARRERPHHGVGPDADVVLRVGDHNRLARGPARSVQPDHFFQGAGEQAERIAVAQVRLHRERKAGQVVQRPDVFRRDVPLIHPPAVEFNVLVGTANGSPQAAQLQVPHLRNRQVVRRAGRMNLAESSSEIRSWLVRLSRRNSMLSESPPGSTD